MSSYNRIIMMGNLTRVPELKKLNSGQAVCNLGIATNRQFKTKDGDNSGQEVCFVDVQVWGVQAENCHKYLDKGSSVLVEGRLKLDSWHDQEGNKRSKHSIVADRITFVRSQQGASESDSSFSSENAADKGEISMKNDNAFKDDLPF